jgi:hypothetical protein
VTPGYDYVEGEVPVPANRCTRCGGPLVTPTDPAAGSDGGWFRPSRLNKGIWIYRSAGAPDASGASTLLCPKCQRRYALQPTP